MVRVGDRVRFVGAAQTVVGLSGTLVRLVDDQGRASAVALAHLLADPGFERNGETSRAGLLPAGLLARVPQEAVDEALWWEPHIVEVLTGLRPDAPAGARARPRFDPATRSLEQRERAKASELARSGRDGVSARTVRRKRQRYEISGLVGLLDWRVDRRRPVNGRTDARVVAALEQAIGEASDGSTRTASWFQWRTEQILAEVHGPGVVAMPARATFYRLFDRLTTGRHTTGSARTRRSLANRPRGPFGQVTAARPGELVQIDSTPLDVLVLLEQGVVERVELTGVVDLATRSIPAVVLRPTTKAVDASLLLARTVTPEPMRPGWTQALAMSRSVLPHRRMLQADQRLVHAAATPVIVPETIVCDRGKVFLSQTFRTACRMLGISVQPAHPHSPTDKPHIERTLESVASLFTQYVSGYTGRSAEYRGRRVEQERLWSLMELQELLDEWIVACWQNRPHDGLRDPAAPGRAFTPNEKYATLVESAGYLPVALSAQDYIELLPARWQAINAYGIKVNHRVYDDAALNPLRRQRSGVADKKHLWEVHHDPYDVSRIWVRNHWEGGWITVFWRHLNTVPAPFGELAWNHAREQLAAEGNTPTEEEIAKAVAALLERASRGPDAEQPATARPAGKGTRRARQVAARTRATGEPAWPRPQAPAPAQAEPLPEAAPDAGGTPAEADDEVDEVELAEVVPLKVFDARKEADRWW